MHAEEWGKLEKPQGLTIFVLCRKHGTGLRCHILRGRWIITLMIQIEESESYSSYEMWLG